MHSTTGSVAVVTGPDGRLRDCDVTVESDSKALGARRPTLRMCRRGLQCCPLHQAQHASPRGLRTDYEVVPQRRVPRREAPFAADDPSRDRRRQRAHRVTRVQQTTVEESSRVLRRTYSHFARATADPAIRLLGW
jgi:hypothetical protein